MAWWFSTAERTCSAESVAMLATGGRAASGAAGLAGRDADEGVLAEPADDGRSLDGELPGVGAGEGGTSGAMPDGAGVAAFEPDADLPELDASLT